MLRPRTTKNFPASFNFIMKAWTATNSQIGTKAHLRAATLYTTSSNLPLGPFPFKRTRVCMKTNVCGSTTHLFILRLGRGQGWGPCAYRFKPVFMCAPPPTPPHPFSFSPSHQPKLHPPSAEPALHTIRCTLP